MNVEETQVALAARATGEELPGTDATELDRLIRDDRELAADFGSLCATVEFLRGARVPADARRCRAVAIGIDRRRRAASLRMAAAAVLLISGAAATLWLRRDRPVAADHLRSTFSPFVEVFAGPFAKEAASPEPAETPRGAPTLGGSAPSTELPRPFTAQADFVLLAPTPMPAGCRLVAARFRRAAPGVRPFSFAWLEFTTPDGTLIVLETPDASPDAERLATSALPEGWRSIVAHREGTLAVVAGPATTERLSALATVLAATGR